MPRLRTQWMTKEEKLNYEIELARSYKQQSEMRMARAKKELEIINRQIDSLARKLAEAIGEE